ncbi:dipeptidase [Falsiroseomonas stagni]|uniref:Acetylornithine deacetylase/Succinyl-diaminopimelate desuccinylase n=1 Tax=Falsiroseomonas stagni DSM 19981 TaxID=1123062 RepID=A0A1I4D2M9_9PROT|nr:dipeptidase [Falsiroseomonas stagni]SFK86989.1 Acetylornithine deacetylase/Succinyl-diaminopimelate desuccinylase [Falsiroseomonas stagni DSM 19981]
MDLTDKLLAAIDADHDAAVGRLVEWLRIPSISAQPDHAADCVRAAEWVRDQLVAIGFTASLRQTPKHPVVVAHHPGPATGAKAPHLLYYGHYDVQPPDPLELWTSPPFEPVIVDGPHGKRVVARGAVDDKGQTLMWIEAMRAWHSIAGGPPCAITAVIEGEEEIGSPNLAPFMAANSAELAADVAIISDTGMWDIDTPALSTRLRGMVFVQLDIKAANRDLHSGMYGGSALNPNNLITKILGDLHDAEGRVQLPGFYDGIPEVSPELRAQWQALGFSEHDFLGAIGLSVPVGEKGRGALERLWARPTADINGIWGGYTGPGSKTVIPSEAHAKITFRLVPGQHHDKVFDAFKQFVHARLPADATASFQGGSASPGIEVPADSGFVTAARVALADEYGKPAAMIGCGGSIPVVSSLKDVLGLDTVLMGFGLEDDQVHSPNEKFDMRCFHQGTRSHARLLARLASA